MLYSFARMCAVLLCAAECADAQVVFSRRVYSESGRTWHQIWMWNPEDGKIKAVTSSARNHYRPTCDPRQDVIYFHPGDDTFDDRQTWSYDRATRIERPVIARPAEPEQRRVPLVGCESSAWNPEYSRGACTVGQNVVFYDAAQGAISARVRFEQRPTPPDVLGWSPNGEWLLVSTMGANDNSTQRQSDYFFLNAKDDSWKAAGSGNNAFWVPGRNEIVYSTPRDLTPRSRGSRHQVWTSQLVTVNPATGQRTEVTKGRAYNIQPAPCVRR